MQSVEIVIFFFVAVIASGFFIVFILGIDYTSVQETFFDSTKNKGADYDKKTTLNELATVIEKCWSGCSFGDNNLDCGVFYVVNEDYAQSDLNEIKQILLKRNLCIDCNLLVPKSDLPTVVKVSCLDSINDHIIISK
jgi:hypothetical protein